MLVGAAGVGLCESVAKLCGPGGMGVVAAAGFAEAPAAGFSAAGVGLSPMLNRLPLAAAVADGAVSDTSVASVVAGLAEELPRNRLNRLGGALPSPVAAGLDVAGVGCAGSSESEILNLAVGAGVAGVGVPVPTGGFAGVGSPELSVAGVSFDASTT